MKKNEVIGWEKNLTSQEWDSILASLNGHPLQSAKWGDSRELADGIKDTRWVAFKNGKPIYLARIEERNVFGLIKIAWIPRGPTVLDLNDECHIQEELLKRLKKIGYILCIINPWRKVELESTVDELNQTIWVDLSVGKEELWLSLSTKFRNDVRRAKKKGVVVERVSGQKDVIYFYELCKSISNSKGFYLNTSVELMLDLLKNNSIDGIEAHLFVARHEEKFCGGAFIIRCGKSVHYVWGATDRTFSNLRVCETVQWEVIEWALDCNCMLYDLEGIDLKNNLGTYNFKKKLGGQIISLPGKRVFILNKYIKALVNFFRVNDAMRFFSVNIRCDG
jgi:lipid II:glycine glycyltransferase (peptidoglycan interpeptide bridge formation enzyme)